MPASREVFPPAGSGFELRAGAHAAAQNRKACSARGWKKTSEISPAPGHRASRAWPPSTPLAGAGDPSPNDRHLGVPGPSRGARQPTLVSAGRDPATPRPSTCARAARAVIARERPGALPNAAKVRTSRLSPGAPIGVSDDGYSCPVGCTSPKCACRFRLRRHPAADVVTRLVTGRNERSGIYNCQRMRASCQRGHGRPDLAGAGGDGCRRYEKHRGCRPGAWARFHNPRPWRSYRLCRASGAAVGARGAPDVERNAAAYRTPASTMPLKAAVPTVVSSVTIAISTRTGTNSVHTTASTRAPG
jgi:hypothetical protein